MDTKKTARYIVVDRENPQIALHSTALIGPAHYTLAGVAQMSLSEALSIASEIRNELRVEMVPMSVSAWAFEMERSISATESLQNGAIEARQ